MEKSEDTMYEKGYNAGWFLALEHTYTIDRILYGTNSKSQFFEGMRDARKEVQRQQAADLEKVDKKIENMKYNKHLAEERRKDQEYDEKVKKDKEAKEITQAQVRSQIENDPIEQRMKELSELRQGEEEKRKDLPERDQGIEQ